MEEAYERAETRGKSSGFVGADKGLDHGVEGGERSFCWAKAVYRQTGHQMGCYFFERGTQRRISTSV